MASKRLRIYIAGPYTAASKAAVLANVNRAIDVGIALFKKGHIPFIPHLTHFVDLRAREVGIRIAWQEYIEWDLSWLTLCDALLYLDSSPGADVELAQAQRFGKRIFYCIEEIPDVVPRRSQRYRDQTVSVRRRQRAISRSPVRTQDRV